jgi:hypothetical protein
VLTALACAIVSASTERVAEVERFICDDQRREALIAEGLVLRAVYRIAEQAGRLLVLHGWRADADLRAYVAKGERDPGAALSTTGARAEQFTGRIVAQFSWLES